MRIKHLKLNNIGSFAGEHNFSFNIDNLQKNIVLIGGRNGAGKTTLFESMRLCLYGYKLYGYRQNSQTYTNKIKRLINDAAKAESSANASITMQICIEDGYANDIFEINRHWVLAGKDLREDLTVRKCDQLLNSEELQDFENYLLQIMPPALFNFHFFNSENISDFMFDHANGQAFRKAFLQICGLDTFDLLEEQLQNNVRNQKSNQNNDTQIKYDIAKQELLTATSSHKQASERVTNTQKKIDSLEDQIAVLDKTMEHYGGTENSKWKVFQQKLKEEESKREELRHTLKEAANDVIPFIILKKELAALKQQLTIEEQLRRNRLFKERLFDNKVRQGLEKELKPYLSDTQTATSEEFINALYNIIKEECPANGVEYLHLSENENMDLLVKINRYANYDIQSIIDAERAVDDSLEYVKKLRAEMDSKEVIDSKHYLAQKNDLLMQLNTARKELLEAKIGLMQTEESLKAKQKAYDKAYEDYRAILKERSVTDISARTLLAFSELKQQLYVKYVALVESSFSTHFRRLISKTDLIDGIYISSSFAVIAYKQSEINISDVLGQIKEYGEDYVRDSIGERAFNIIQESGHSNGVISVPIKIEQHFSAGEQQIFAMALYQSLAEIRTAELPFVIDTPLARIDHEHRKNILLNFFAQLPGQVIILSTDEEINGEGISLISGKISDIYLIEHQSGGTSSVTRNSYFKGVLN